MKICFRLAGLVVAAALIPIVSAAGKNPPQPSSRAADSAAVVAAEQSLDSLAAAERAFAALSVEKGMKDAFLAYLGRDGRVFRRGFVNGQKAWKDRKNPAGTLSWAPAYAEAAGNADLGWTTGPWEYRSPKGDSDYGTFVTVWDRPIEFVREEDRVWRVALDLGIGHARPQHGVAETKLERGPLHQPVSLTRRPGVGVGLGLGVASGGFGFGVGSGRSARDVRWREMRHAVNDLLSTDRSYAFDLRKNGASDAVGKYMSDDVRVFREGAEPAAGKMPAIQALATANRDRVWTPLGSHVSTSFDIGYSWGLARTVASPTDTSAYLRIWRCDARGKWVLIADVENAFAK